jgi:hypothetical protein
MSTFFKTTFPVLTTANVQDLHKGHGYTRINQMHILERHLNSQIETFTTGGLTLLGSGGGGGYGGNKLYQIPLMYLTTPAEALQFAILAPVVDGSLVQGSGIYFRVVTLSAFSADVDVIKSYTLVDDTAMIDFQVPTTTTLTSGSILAFEVSVPAGQTFGGVFAIDIIRTGIPT